MGGLGASGGAAEGDGGLAEGDEAPDGVEVDVLHRLLRRKALLMVVPGLALGSPPPVRAATMISRTTRVQMR